jgi:hypothetical protein
MGHDDARVVLAKGEHDSLDRGCNRRNHAVFSRSDSRIRTSQRCHGTIVHHQGARGDQRPFVRVALAQGGFAGLVAAAHNFDFAGNPGRDDVAMRCRAAMVAHWVLGKDCQRHRKENALDARVY